MTGKLSFHDPDESFIEPREVAAAMLFLCSADASAMTGQAINVTGEPINPVFARRSRRLRCAKEEDRKDRICTSWLPHQQSIDACIALV
jgi:hypothetical protein